MSQICSFASALDERNVVGIARAIIIAEEAMLGGHKCIRLVFVRLNINKSQSLRFQDGVTDMKI